MCQEKEVIICRCEEVTQGEILTCIHDGAKSLREIKLTTRAGMGLCQGRTCNRLVIGILSREMGISPRDIIPAKFRPPLRPIPLKALSGKRGGDTG